MNIKLASLSLIPAKNDLILLVHSLVTSKKCKLALFNLAHPVHAVFLDNEIS